MLKKYNQYVLLNEKKDVKAEKADIEEKIMKLLKEKPEVKGSDKWPDCKGIYSLAAIKKYVGGEDNMKIDQVFNDMRDDEKIKHIRIKINAFGVYPYFYYEDHTSKEEAEKCKASMEKSQPPVEKKNKPKVEVKVRKSTPRKKAEKNIDTTEKEPVVKKPKAEKAEKKTVTETDLKAKAKEITTKVTRKK
jgi:hypothetical protein